MKVIGWLKAVLSIVFAAVIGLAVAGVANLVHPAESLGWVLGTVLTASVLSALVAFFVTVTRTKKQGPAPVKKGGTDTEAAVAGGKTGAK